MEQRKQHIVVQLDAHRVAMNVDADKEPLYRRAGLMLNKLYQSYRQARPEASAEQLWAYVALHVGVNLYADVREKDTEPIKQKIQEMNQAVETCLNGAIADSGKQ